MSKVYLQDVCADLDDFEWWATVIMGELGHPIEINVDDQSRIFMEIPDEALATAAKLRFHKSN